MKYKITLLHSIIGGLLAIALFEFFAPIVFNSYPEIYWPFLLVIILYAFFLYFKRTLTPKGVLLHLLVFILGMLIFAVALDLVASLLYLHIYPHGQCHYGGNEGCMT